MYILQVSITWKQCNQLPTRLENGRAAVLNGKVYCGGMTDYRCVYCYDPSWDKWTTLPPLPVRYYGLGQVCGELVVVGGQKISNGKGTNEIYTYDGKSHKWKWTIPPMPTARWCINILNLQSALAVAGGITPLSDSYTAAVEIFKPDTSQWYRTDPLPTPCSHVSLVAIGNTCYALGGWNRSYLNEAFYASVDNLLGSAVPANQTTHSGSSDSQLGRHYPTLQPINQLQPC